MLLSCSGNPAFQSTRPIRGATPLVSSSAYLLRNFNPRAPYGARRPGTAVPATPGNFNPRAPYGARRHRTCRRTQPRNFNPRAPYGARLMGCVSSAAASHFNPRAPYGARRPAGHCISRHDGISIHAPHTGRDKLIEQSLEVMSLISIHAPHTGRDELVRVKALRPVGFQSTRPIRGATILSGVLVVWLLFQSTRPIRGATCLFLLANFRY